MDKYLLCGVMLTALIAGGQQARAQDNNAVAYAKGGEGQMSKDLSYMQPVPARPAPVQTQAAPITTPAPVTTATSMTYKSEQEIEPATTDSDFTGPYAGAEIGYGFGKADAAPGPDADDVDGVAGGVFAGYGFNALGGYAGLEAGYEWSGMDGDAGAASFKKDDSWHVTVRPGVVVDQNKLLYGIGGFTRAQFKTGGDQDHLNGWVLGAGAECDSKSLPFGTRIEYQYKDYEDATIGGTNFEPTDHNVKIGAVFRL